MGVGGALYRGGGKGIIGNYLGKTNGAKKRIVAAQIGQVTQKGVPYGSERVPDKTVVAYQ